MSTDDLPLPEILTENISDPDLVAAFLCRYREVGNAKRPSNVPTACLLDGVRGEATSELGEFSGIEEVYIYWDEGEKLRKDSMEAVRSFWDSREPWEDYDFCVFPRSLKWCLGFTHNDYWVKQEFDGS